MKRALIGGAVLASLLAAVAGAAERNFVGYKSYELPAYTLVTRDAKAVRRIPGEIAKVDGLLAKLFNRETRHAGVPAYILVVPHGIWQRYLNPGSAIVGEFLPGHFASYILLDSSLLDSEGYFAVHHEYTHLYLWTQIRGVHPLWFDEGLAVLVEYTNFGPSTAKIGLPWSTTTSWQRTLLPMARLLTINKSSPEYRDSATSHSVHLQSWAMVHRGVIADRAFGKQMFDFIAALNEMQPVDQAVQASFGMNTAQLDASMSDYVRRLYFDIAKLELDFPVPPTVPPGRDMSEVEVLEFLAEVMFTSGYQPQRLASLIQAAQRRAPGSASVHALRMRLAVRDRDDSALQRLLAEIEPRLTDPLAARSVGLALFERVRVPESSSAPSAVDVEVLSRRALELLQRAVVAESNDLEAVCAYATLAARLRQDMAHALEHVQRMRTYQPSNGDLAMAAALLFEAQGDAQGIAPYLVDIVRFSNWDDQREWAALRLGRQQNAQ